MIAVEGLKSVPLFSALSEEKLGALARCVTVRKFPRRTFIMRAGEQADDLYVMLSGRAKMSILDEKGNEIILAVIGLREMFGEMGLVDGQPRSASVETLKPCEVMCVPKTGFLRCLSDNVGLAMGLINGLMKQLRGAHRQIESLALMGVYGRVVRVLLDLSENIDGARVIQKGPPKQEIAHMIGASRESVSRVIRDLRKAGHIRIHKRRIVLLESLRSDGRTLPSNLRRPRKGRMSALLSSRRTVSLDQGAV